MSKKTKELKKKITIVSICLVVAVVIAIVIGVGKPKDDSDVKNAEQTENVGTDQSELEVVEEEVVQSENVIVEKEDATYERWLAASMVLGISMQYPEFEFKEIYLASETELENHSESNGAYVVFQCGEEEVVLHSKPLESERTEAGTKDLHADDLGFATFDEVDMEDINKEEYVKVELDELTELINQSVLVSVYEH